MKHGGADSVPVWGEVGSPTVVLRGFLGAPRAPGAASVPHLHAATSLRALWAPRNLAGGMQPPQRSDKGVGPVSVVVLRRGPSPNPKEPWSRSVPAGRAQQTAPRGGTGADPSSCERRSAPAWAPPELSQGPGGDVGVVVSSGGGAACGSASSQHPGSGEVLRSAPPLVENVLIWNVFISNIRVSNALVSAPCSNPYEFGRPCACSFPQGIWFSG